MKVLVNQFMQALFAKAWIVAAVNHVDRKCSEALHGSGIGLLVGASNVIQ
jgi:hypothetical protein